MPFTVVFYVQGPPNTKEYRLFVEEDGKPISSWHDIPLRNEDGTLNFVCEIPANTSAKMEVATVCSSSSECLLNTAWLL